MIARIGTVVVVAFFSGLDQLAGNHFPFVLAQTNVVYLSPGRGGREVEVELATTHVGTSSFTQAYRIREGKGGRVLCEGEARLVCVDPSSGRKVPEPAGE